MTHTINVPLFRKTLEHITLNPGEWNQHSWFAYHPGSPCKTVACLAGHAAVLSGVELAGYRHEGVMVYECASDGRVLSTVARDALGLAQEQADRLFNSDNSLSDLWRLAEEYTYGDIQASDMESVQHV